MEILGKIIHLVLSASMSQPLPIISVTHPSSNLSFIHSFVHSGTPSLEEQLGGLVAPWGEARGNLGP